MFAPGARIRARWRRSARHFGGVSLALVGALALLSAGAAPRPARAAEAVPPPGERMARERARRLDAIVTLLRELPAADRTLTAAGRLDPERTRRITRLLGLRGHGLGTVPESTAVAAGWLDLLLDDGALTSQPIGPRLAAAADGALQLLLADPPRPRARTIELLQSLRLGPPPPAEVWPVTYARHFGSVVTPLPRASAGEATVLVEGSIRGAPPLERRVDVPPGATARWLPDGSGLLIVGRDRLYRLLPAEGAEPIPLGPLLPGAPLALSPDGRFAAGVAPAGGADTLGALTLFRLGPHVDAVVLGRGRRIAALAWVDGGARLAALVDGTLRLYELAITRPRELDLGITPERMAAARMIASPAEIASLSSTPATTTGHGGWRLRLIDTTAMKVLDTRALDTPGPLAFAPDGARLFMGGQDGPLVLGLEGDRFGSPAPLRGPGSPAPTRGDVTAMALSPRGGALALTEADPGAGPGGALPPGPLLATSRFLTVTARARTESTGGADTTLALSPDAGDLAWHPSGRWLAVAHPLGQGRRLLLLHDLATGDAIPLGRGDGEAPLFSPGGASLLWREAGSPGHDGDEFVIRRLEPLPAVATAAGQWGALAFDAYNAERPSDALTSYRNAVRLAPGVARHRLGLARAYRALADPMSVGGLRGWYLEGAARAAATAFELDSRSPEIRLEFYEDQLLRASLVGRRVADRLRSTLEAEQQSYDGPTLYEPSPERATALLEQCVTALLWQPFDDGLRALYERLAARARVR